MSYDPTNDPIPVTEDDVRDAITGCYVISDDDVDATALYVAYKAACEAWDGDGWYETMVGGHVWGYDDAYYYGDLVDLAVNLYTASAETSTWESSDYLNEVWASQITDPDDIAELEAMLA